jgi:formate hydrogenlyase subunit 3/multisubunit Na+/H+ antiporter MnhD subunit
VTLLALAFAVLGLGALGALATGRAPALSNALGGAGAVLGSALGTVPALRVLAGAELAPVDLPWAVPGGRLSLAIDPLSAFFLVPIFLVSAATAVYGAAYFRHATQGRSSGAVWGWFDLLVAAMAVVVTARNAVLFLVAWEGMALASYFLVVFHHDRAEVRRAGWIYLVATHLGTAFLLVFFAALGAASGSLDFARFATPERGAGALFALALVGFGSKAGLFPLHVWLPEAHPAAPSPVSALLSGVMIKTGIYGVVRTLTWLGTSSTGSGLALLAVGGASALFGVLLALSQRDLKRLLAYSSVENVGVIALGLGLGALGASAGAPAVAALGYAGALLHVWGHAATKTLLFLAAGSAGHAARTLDVERLGGLLRRMPRTGAAFAVGAASICALPPLAGFPAEFTLLLAALSGVAAGQAQASLLLALAGLGLVGGLAVACFAKAMGIAWLGAPRSEGAAKAREVRGAMTATCLALAAVCAAIGLGSPLVLALARPVLATLAPASPAAAAALRDLATLLGRVGEVGGALLVVIGAVALLRRTLLRGREVREGPTWDCGYAAPTSRMQYTGASFVQPITQFFEATLGPTRAGTLPQALFPTPARLEGRVSDPANERLFVPLFAAVDALARRSRWLQSGSTHLYVLYVVLATGALFLWKLG